MKRLCIQIQPERVPELDEALLRRTLSELGAGTALVNQVGIDEGEDDGRYLNFNYKTPDVGRLWSLIRREVLNSPALGPAIRQAAIITCQGDAGWDDYLLLHHLDDDEPLDVPDKWHKIRRPDLPRGSSDNQGV
jgi:hypothetical protein